MRFWSKVTDPASMPWEDVEASLLTCEHYWVATVGPDGAPSVRPVWGTWLDDRLLLSVGSTTIGKHMETSDKVTVHLESALDVVIVEGTAAYESDPQVLGRFCERYNPKYRWDFTAETTGWIVGVRPTRVLAWKTVPVAECHPGMTTFPLAGAQFRP